MSKEMNKLIRILFVCIAIATVINGSVFWLKKVGWLNKEELMILKQQGAEFEQQIIDYVKNPSRFTKSDVDSFYVEYNKYLIKLSNYAYQTKDSQILTKLVKYLVIISLLIALAYTALQDKKNTQYKINSFLGFLLFVLMAITIINNDWQTAVAGLYSCTFLLILMFAGRSINSENLNFLATMLFMTLVFLALLSPIEIIQIKSFYQNESFLSKRISGFMILPNTLGIYAICVCAFCLSMWSRQGLIRHVILIVITIWLVLISGSKTAVVVLPVLIFLYFLHANENRVNQMLFFSALLISLILLYMNIIRGNGFESVLGRIDKYYHYFATNFDIVDLLFGRGIGLSSNLLHQIYSIFPLQSGSNFLLIPTDSSPLLLIIQTGIVGCLLFYGFLIYAMIKHPELRLIYVAIILCSFSINILELFPINLLLSLLLAYSIKIVSQSQQKPINSR